MGGASHFGDDTWRKLCTFAQLLEQNGEKLGLIGPRELERLWARHILNSLAIVPGIQSHGASSVADIGSGAGFPGIPAALVLPHVRFTLIETMDRRAQWLNFVAHELCLANVEVKHARAEECTLGVYDVVTARAVAPLKKLVPWALPLVRKDGSLLALKGARAEDEIAEAERLFSKFHIDWIDIHEERVWGTSESTRVVDVHKEAR